MVLSFLNVCKWDTNSNKDPNERIYYLSSSYSFQKLPSWFDKVSVQSWGFGLKPSNYNRLFLDPMNPKTMIILRHNNKIQTQHDPIRKLVIIAQ